MGGDLRFDTLGGFTVFGHRFTSGEHLAFGPDGALYVSERNTNRAADLHRPAGRGRRRDVAVSGHHEKRKKMDSKIMRLPSAVVIGIALIVAMVLTPTVDADAAPVVAPGFEAAVFARVTDPFRLSFDSNGNLYVGRDNSGSGGGSR